MNSITLSCAGMALAAGSVSASQLVIIATAAAIALMTMISRMRRRRDVGPSPRAYAREQLARLEEEKTVHDEIGEIMTQLRQLAREIDVQLDAKFIRLERGIRDADDRIDRLNRELRRASGSAALDVTVADECVPPRPPSEPRDGADHDRILAFADQGHTPTQIAQSIGRPVGEVQLVLSLRKHQIKPAMSSRA